MEITIRKADRSIDVNLTSLGFADDLSAQAEYVIRYGLTQSLNDAHASLPTGTNPDEIMAIVEKKLAAIYDGSVRVASGGGPSGLSPHERIVNRIARTEVRAAIKAAGKTVKAVGKEPFDAAVERHIENARGRLDEMATAELASLADVTIDIDALMVDDDDES